MKNHGKKYSRFLSKQFVENSVEVRWCPSPGCSKAVYEPIVEGDNFIGICSCGFKFCWKCNKNYHTPLSCDDMTKWDEKNSSGDVLSLKWMQENTKQCPKCKNPIEKNDGCFQMTCSQCHHQFCWLCRGDWFTHGDHFKCNKYTDGQLQNKPEFRGGDKNSYISQNYDNTFLYYYEIIKNYEGTQVYENDVKKKKLMIYKKKLKN